MTRLTYQEKETIENVCKGLLILMFALLIIASLWIMVKYNDLVIEHNEILQENNACYEYCPGMKEGETDENKFNEFEGFKIG